MHSSASVIVCAMADESQPTPDGSPADPNPTEVHPLDATPTESVRTVDAPTGEPTSTYVASAAPAPTAEAPKSGRSVLTKVAAAAVLFGVLGFGLGGCLGFLVGHHRSDRFESVNRGNRGWPHDRDDDRGQFPGGQGQFPGGQGQFPGGQGGGQGQFPDGQGNGRGNNNGQGRGQMPNGQQPTGNGSNGSGNGAVPVMPGGNTGGNGGGLAPQPGAPITSTTVPNR